jgi:hypothetical protein
MSYNHEAYYDESKKGFNCPLPAEAPDWWRNRVIALRNATSVAEHRSICSTPAMPIEYRSAAAHAANLSRTILPYGQDDPVSIDQLCEQAWQEMIAGLHQARERRRALLNSVLN